MCMVNSGFVVVRVWRHETIVDVVSVGSGVGRIIRVESCRMRYRKVTFDRTACANAGIKVVGVIGVI